MNNPVYDGYFADPFVWHHDGHYYAVGTGLVESDGLAAGSAARVFPLLTSDDLQTWRSLGGAMERLDPSLGEHYWAPEVAFADGVFFLYYSVGGENDLGHHLRVATTTSPTEPFRDCGVSLTGAECGIPFAIDASPFQDTDGQWYLFYARDFLDTDNGNHAGTALAVDRLVSMTELAGEERTVLRARHDWTIYQAQRTMYGKIWDWHTLEGPQVRYRHGKYWLLFSGARWETERYGVDWAFSERVMGTYSGESSDAPRLLKSTPTLVGPGHNCVVSGVDGVEYLVFHAWNSERTKRQMHIMPMEWTDSGPRLLEGDTR